LVQDVGSRYFAEEGRSVEVVKHGEEALHATKQRNLTAAIQQGEYLSLSRR
jgi:CheY-like chemotaxis protein